MGEVHHIVDHLKLEYQGVFDLRNLFRMFTKWFQEHPYERGGDYVSEQNTSHGKCIEFFYYPWMKHSDSLRYYFKIRMLVYDLKKVDILVDGKKKRMDHGKFILYLDGFIEYDYEYRWQHKPMLQFIRTLYLKVFYKYYSKYSEKKIIDDSHNLYEMFERFFNMYRSYKPIQEVPHFYY